jgi:hypothetical protein
MTVSITAVNVGAAPADGTGDPARTAFTKLNANDTALAAAIASLGSGGGGFNFVGTVADYASLPTGLGTGDKEKGWVVVADGLVYVWDGSAFPANGAGAPFQGPGGTNGIDGINGAPADGLVPFNTQTVASYVAQPSDVGTSIEMDYASANTVVINPGVFSANQLVPVRCAGAGTTTIAPAAGMNIYTAGLLSLTQYQLGMLHFKDSSTAYFDAPNATTATAAIAITTSFPAPVVGTAYAGYVHGTNTGGATGTMAYTVNALPAGLSLNASTGDITGTPTTAGTVASTFGVTNGTQSQAPTHSFVTSAAPVMTLTGTLPGGTVGTAYSADLTLGGTYTTPVTIDFSSGTKPAWMTVTVGTGKVTFSGTPTTAETETFTPRATDSSGTPQTATAAQSIVIAASSSGPSVVQSRSTTVTGGVTSGGLSFTGTPTAGNKLIAGVSVQVFGGGATVATPTGWTFLNSRINDTITQYLFTKVSDGTETGISVTVSKAAHIGISIAEVVGTFGTVSGKGLNQASGNTSYAVGPSDAPIGAASIPLAFIGSQGFLAGTPPTVGSPWTLATSTGTNTNAFLAYRAAPNAAASATLTIQSPTSTVETVQDIVWLDP